MPTTYQVDRVCKLLFIVRKHVQYEQYYSYTNVSTEDDTHSSHTLQTI